jgi:hypothetical protein
MKRGDDGAALAAFRLKPSQCSIRRDARARSQVAGLTKVTWRGWGKPEASARATLVLATGERRAVTVRAYGVRPDCTGTYRVYTRVQVTLGGRKTTYRPATCMRAAR